jgi:hypothetical protein
MFPEQVLTELKRVVKNYYVRPTLVRRGRLEPPFDMEVECKVAAVQTSVSYIASNLLFDRNVVGQIIDFYNVHHRENSRLRRYWCREEPDWHDLEDAPTYTSVCSEHIDREFQILTDDEDVRGEDILIPDEI